jgi:hydrogenase small subunit
MDAIEVLWITAVLGGDGDTIAMTAATDPSLEDLVLGAIPECLRACCAIRV